MKKIIPFIAIAALFSISIAQDYTKVIHRADGRSFAIRTTDVDSVSYVPSEQVPYVQYNWVDTIYKEIHDTLVNNYFIHDTIIQENVVLVHDTIYIDTEPKKTYTINGVEYPMPEAVDLGLPSGTLWANMNIGSNNSYEEGLLFACGETSIKEEFTEENYSMYDYFSEPSKEGEAGLFCYKWSSTNHDAAYIYTNCNFCLPSKDQYYELTENCMFEELDTVIVCTSKINGIQIVFPFTFRLDGYQCGYYTCLIQGPHTHCAYYESNFNNYVDWETDLYKGMCIRPVLAK